ncbi:GGDEF domain-containing protein [Paracandidimonas soli]|uniref:Diguanylate cyclase (GGDEF)-like protein n=1 Tax=Paracandidimonas soli TaxID=1917182 RepID=A0A4R3V0V8_9BURK|nr:GGDEF domain-containing protein [Paracandidimonas soli]TCU98345.1 diguanylate cyclase (GGDEF)-like protein [Paracandidimonas soli]
MKPYGDPVAGVNASPVPEAHTRLLSGFGDILERRALTPLFQPIADLRTGDIVGYEGLIRGPVDSQLFSPEVLFRVAGASGRSLELESLCRAAHIARFHELGLEGKLFLNVSPEVLLHPAQGLDILHQRSGAGDDDIGSLVIELTESASTSSYDRLRQAAADYRSYGLQVAIDDLGAGFSSLRLWSELRPEFVKIDKYFIRGLESDPVKRQFVRSILEIARQSCSLVIAEGIETPAELEAVIRIGIPLGQGFYLSRPAGMPARKLPQSLLETMAAMSEHRGDRAISVAVRKPTARSILRSVPVVEHSARTNEVYEIFKQQADLQALVVQRHGKPIGLINRLRMLERLARPYHRELYGGKPCSQFIENEPLVVDHATSLQELGHLITEVSPQHLSDGFIIVEDGRCIGVGNGQDLIREITQMQLKAARYANPLTQLPGNVPVSEYIEGLLRAGEPFAVCHCDLDNFKPFNDLYGYLKGDEVIQMTADLLRECTDPDKDFLGHVGGDDFIIVFGSADWRERCETILQRFMPATQSIYRQADVLAGGYTTRNRQGQEVFHDLVTISLGITTIPGNTGLSSHFVAELAASAKAQAKKTAGNAMFVERRSTPREIPARQREPGASELADLRARRVAASG